MLIKAGVDISRLKRMIRRALFVCEFVLERHGIELVVTSTYEGNHSAGSLHYSNDAFDIRSERISEPILNQIRIECGNDYDIVDENDHIHIEYDQK